MAVQTTLTNSHWRDRFVERRGRHRGLVVEVPSGCPLPPGLGPSLATFQLGESGTGEHLLGAARRASGDEAYLEALEHFVAEEQEHARLLALVLHEIEVPLLTSHWTDRIFVLVRRLHSLRTEVLVLLVAEVIALTYYSSLRDGVRQRSLVELFGRIHEDEVLHVEFHCQTLPTHLARFSPVTRRIVRLVWNVLVTGASVVVCLDHGRLLVGAGVPRRAFLRRVGRDRREMDRRLFGP